MVEGIFRLTYSWLQADPNNDQKLGGRGGNPSSSGENAENRLFHINALQWPQPLTFIRVIIIIMKSWDDNNKSFEMLARTTYHKALDANGQLFG